MDENAVANIKNDFTGVFNRAAPTYDQVGPRFFSYFGQRLVDLAGLTPGLKVLDVATGRGSVLFPAARQVGPTGQVIGIDLAEGMIEQTSKVITSQRWGNISLLQMDGEQLSFEDSSFDVILCGFGVFFFPQIRLALSEFYRTLKPGGKIAFSSWGKSDPRWNWLQEVGLRPKPRKSSEGDKPVHHHNSSDLLQKPLLETGYSPVRIEVETKEFFYRSEDEWWQTEWSHSVRKMLERLTEDQLAQARKNASTYLQKIKVAAGFPVTFEAVFTLSEKPAGNPKG